MKIDRSSVKEILFLSSLGDGIYKSEDGGLSWFLVNRGLPTPRIDLVAIAPDRADLVLAAGTEGGLFRTLDGGLTWHQVLGTERKIVALAFSPETMSFLVR